MRRFRPTRSPLCWEAGEPSRPGPDSAMAGRWNSPRLELSPLQIAPDSMWVRRELGFTYLLGGERAVALASFEKQAGWIHLLGLALAQHDLGRPEEAREALDALVGLEDPPTYQVAQVFAWWGDRDRAFKWLERCRSARDVGLRYAKYDPLLRALRDDARFAAFLKKMNLPPD